ncbi:MAG: hypothetical protein KDK39_15485, partial [Leptospiraceae bacterium]|nr:hypothetical protein [Leptospiraceae bacterium]
PFQRTGQQAGALELLREIESTAALAWPGRLFPVHRLDKVTSGILLFARGRAAATELANHFRYNRVEKVYIALSNRSPQKKQGRVTGDMQKGRRGAWILNRSQNNPAVTLFKSAAIPGRMSGLRLYVIRPKTGKTHQIRVAMKSLSAPILGDPLYGNFALAREWDRTYLHAAAVQFELDGRNYQIHCHPEIGREFLSAEFQQIYKTLMPFFKD